LVAAGFNRNDLKPGGRFEPGELLREHGATHGLALLCNHSTADFPWLPPTFDPPVFWACVSLKPSNERKAPRPRAIKNFFEMRFGITGQQSLEQLGFWDSIASWQDTGFAPALSNAAMMAMEGQNDALKEMMMAFDALQRAWNTGQQLEQLPLGSQRKDLRL